MRYFPSDRTASVSVVGDVRCLDRRRRMRLGAGAAGAVEGGPSSSAPASGAGGKSDAHLSVTPPPSTPSSFLPAKFQKHRHLCNKWSGGTSGHGGAGGGGGGALAGVSILASSVMEPSDFHSIPRTGRAVDFVYRMSLFDRPVVELGGKKFAVHDSGAMGSHKADASSLEMSDASLSVALLAYGSTMRDRIDDDAGKDEDPTEDVGTAAGGDMRNGAPNGKSVAGARVILASDGTPLIYMKLSNGRSAIGGGGEDSAAEKGSAGYEVRPFRPSLVRAALLVTSARQEAQLQVSPKVNCTAHY